MRLKILFFLNLTKVKFQNWYNKIPNKLNSCFEFYFILNSKIIEHKNQNFFQTKIGLLSLESISLKNHPYWNLGVNRSSRDHFFRISHLNIEFLVNVQLKRNAFDQNFWSQRSMTPKLQKMIQRNFFLQKSKSHKI